MTNLAVIKSISSKIPSGNGWASTTLILNQVPNIADGWNSINETKYKVEKYRVIMQIISKNVDKLSDGVNIMQALQRRWTITNNDDEAVSMIRIRTEASQLHELHTTTKGKIDHLKMKVHKLKRSLVHLRRHQTTNMLGSSIHFTTNLLQHYAAEDVASLTLTMAQILLAGLVFANGVIYWIAGKELAKPRQINIEILVLLNRIDELESAIAEAAKWIELNDPS